MIRIFQTASGIKKTDIDSVFKARSIALIIISRKSLKMALDICKGISLADEAHESSEVHGTRRGSEILHITFFIEKEKKELMEAAEKSISGFNFKNVYVDLYAESYEKLSGSLIGRLFKEFDYIVFFLALGAAVRLIAPFIKDKLKDPGIIAIDEAGKFVVSLLSGHLGGANKFTVEASAYLGSGAVPVVTTATDALNMFSLDIFAERLDFFIEDAKTKIKIFNKASLNDEKFEIYAENDFYLKKMRFEIDDFSNAGNFSFINKINILKLNSAKIIAVSMNDDFKETIDAVNIAILRPKRLVVGIGCNKNTGFEEIEDFVLSKFAENNFSVNAIRNVATIDLKSQEKGILQFGEKYGSFIDFFTKEEINNFMKNFKDEKSLCFKYTGAYSVCEPCAVLSAKNETKKPVILKQKKGNVTMAVAMVAESGEAGLDTGKYIYRANLIQIKP